MLIICSETFQCALYAARMLGLNRNQYVPFLTQYDAHKLQGMEEPKVVVLDCARLNEYMRDLLITRRAQIKEMACPFDADNVRHHRG